MTPFVMPKYVFEEGLPAFLAKLARLPAQEPVCFDFSQVKHYIPAAIASIVAFIKRMDQNGVPWQFLHHDTNPAFSYFQRVDVCHLLGVEFPWNHTRHDPGASFVPLREVDPTTDCSRHATDLARCMDPAQGDAFRLFQYASEEMMLNAKQHSGSKGYSSAQYTASQDFARIGVADCGQGILGSFQERRPPFYHDGMTHSEALRIAMQPEKSSTVHLPYGPYGRSPNAGVGLSMAAELIRMTYGKMVIVSGNAIIQVFGDNPARELQLPDNLEFPGTVVSLCVQRKHVDSFFEMTTEARCRLGLQKAQGADSLFEL